MCRIFLRNCDVRLLEKKYCCDTHIHVAQFLIFLTTAERLSGNYSNVTCKKKKKKKQKKKKKKKKNLNLKIK